LLASIFISHLLKKKMPTLLLDPPKLDDLDAPQLDERLDDSDNIFSITQEDVARLNASFYEFYSNRSAQSVAISGAALGVGGLIVAAGSASASPTGGGASNAAEAAAASIAAGVTNAINTIEAIGGIGLAAFGAALAPIGFMVTLRVLNMVLSRV
jgi:hypothetical protein